MPARNRITPQNTVRNCLNATINLSFRDGAMDLVGPQQDKAFSREAVDSTTILPQYRT